MGDVIILSNSLSGYIPYEIVSMETQYGVRIGTKHPTHFYDYFVSWHRNVILLDRAQHGCTGEILMNINIYVIIEHIFSLYASLEKL